MDKAQRDSIMAREDALRAFLGKRNGYKPEDLVTAGDTTSEHATACREFVDKIGGVYNAGPFTPFRYRAEGAPPATTLTTPTARTPRSTTRTWPSTARTTRTARTARRNCGYCLSAPGGPRPPRRFACTPATATPDSHSRRSARLVRPLAGGDSADVSVRSVHSLVFVRAGPFGFIGGYSISLGLLRLPSAPSSLHHSIPLCKSPPSEDSGNGSAVVVRRYPRNPRNPCFVGGLRLLRKAQSRPLGIRNPQNPSATFMKGCSSSFYS